MVILGRIIIIFLVIFTVRTIHKSYQERRRRKIEEKSLSCQITKAHNAYAQILHLLFTGAVDVNKKEGGWTPLMHAAFDDTLEIAYHLIKAGADPNARDDNGKTALFYSYGFHQGSIEMVRLLLRSGADVNIATNKGNTVLMYACSIGSLEFVKVLLEAGADVNHVNHQGQTALDVVRTEEGFDPGYEIPFHPEDVKKIQDLLKQYGAK